MPTANANDRLLHAVIECSQPRGLALIPLYGRDGHLGLLEMRDRDPAVTRQRYFDAITYCLTGRNYDGTPTILRVEETERLRAISDDLMKVDIYDPPLRCTFVPDLRFVRWSRNAVRMRH